MLANARVVPGAAFAVLLMAIPVGAVDRESQSNLTLSWERNYLWIRGPQIPGDEIEIHYLEAYCRPGSTDRDWKETVIGHQTEKTFASDDGRVIKLRDTLRDGVVVEHTITAGQDEVSWVGATGCELFLVIVR